MRSSSILQAAASGAALVLSDQREYRAMAAQGFCATLVGASDTAAATRAVLGYTHAPDRRRAELLANAAFVAQHEDHDAQMDALLDLIEAVCEHRLDAVPFGR